MIKVRLSAPQVKDTEQEGFPDVLGGYFRCPSGREDELSDLPHLEFTSKKLPEPFRVCPDHGVIVSTWESRQIAAYTGVRIDRYLLISSLIALSQWRVLRQNPLLRLEDLIHPADVQCIYARARTVQDFALLLDPPIICGGCADFYHCLGADSELIALRDVIAAVNRDTAIRRPDD